MKLCDANMYEGKEQSDVHNLVFVNGVPFVL